MQHSCFKATFHMFQLKVILYFTCDYECKWCIMHIICNAKCMRNTGVLHIVSWIRSGPTGPIGWVSHPPTLRGFDILVELSNQLTYTEQMFRIDSLCHVRIPTSPAQVPCFCRAIRNMSELPSHTSVKLRELALITIYNALTREDG
jgi:hypothetical protein